MLSDAQIAAFERDGYLVVPDAVPDILREKVAAEYEALLDTLYDQWWRAGKVPVE